MKFVKSFLAPGCVTAILLSVGCEDPAAQQRAATQKVITEASRALELATLTAWDPDDESADKQHGRLTAIVRDLSSVRSDEPGQQVATAILSSAANRELARLSLAQAEQVEAQNRSVFEALHSNVDAGLRMQSLADGIEQVSTSELRSMLTAERAGAQQRLRVYSQRLAELDGPIAERETQNERDAREASRLEDEAIALRRQAAEWGHAAGLPTFEQAISLEREADQYEYRIAWRESDLQYDLRPEHELAGSQVAFLSSMLTEIEETEKSLQARDDLSANEVTLTRDLITAYRTQISDELAAVRERSTGALKEYYDEAQGHLERAVSDARTAANKSPRGEADAARLTLVRAYERQGQLFASRARGLSSHAALLERLIAAGGALGNVRSFETDLTEIRAEEAEAIEQAREQLTQAREQLDKVKSRTGQAEIEAFKQGLSKSLSALGAPAPASDTETGTDPSARAARPNRADSGRPSMRGPTGLASPEAVLQLVQSAANADVDSMKQLVGALHTTDPDIQRMVDLQKRAIGPTQALLAAMSEQFGATPDQVLAGMGGPTVPASADARLTDQSDDTATIEVPGQAGAPTQTITAVKLDGGWMIDADGLFPDMDGTALAQVERVSNAFIGMLGDLSQRVRDGEFSSPDQVSQTMMAEIMSAMGAAGESGIPGK